MLSISSAICATPAAAAAASAAVIFEVQMHRRGQRGVRANLTTLPPSLLTPVSSPEDDDCIDDDETSRKREVG